MTTQRKHIGIIGAGLVGSLLSIYLARRGYRVSVFERREDMRKNAADEGRSINLALSARGIRALKEVGLAGVIEEMAIPMHGRMMHDQSGKLTFLAYGRQGQFINSISRSGLNRILIDTAEKSGVAFFFGHRCTAINLDKTSVTFEKKAQADEVITFDQVIGADGAFSTVRSAMQTTERFDYAQHFLEHGYKELRIPASLSGDFVMEKNALHIWPRESFMMIALPNPGGSFTCTLFFPFEGHLSFGALRDDLQVLRFFSDMFPDALAFMPDLLNDYRNHPAGSLVTIKCFPWIRNKTLLIGDAAHAIVPFYGQGMNAGFEDCRILNRLLDEHNDQWEPALESFQSCRKEDADAIAELAIDNFVEMRDLVADERFLLRKKIESRLHERYPEKWIPLYAMVTFNDHMRYSEAREMGKKQAKIMDEVMQTPGIDSRWQELDLREIVTRLP